MYTKSKRERQRSKVSSHLVTALALLVMSSVGFGCKQQDRFASARDRLEKTQLEKDIRRLEEMRRAHPGHQEILSELRRLREELRVVKARLAKQRAGSTQSR